MQPPSLARLRHPRRVTPGSSPALPSPGPWQPLIGFLSLWICLSWIFYFILFCLTAFILYQTILSALEEARELESRDQWSPGTAVCCNHLDTFTKTTQTKNRGCLAPTPGLSDFSGLWSVQGIRSFRRSQVFLLRGNIWEPQAENPVCLRALPTPCAGGDAEAQGGERTRLGSQRISVPCPDGNAVLLHSWDAPFPSCCFSRHFTPPCPSFLLRTSGPHAAHQGSRPAVGRRSAAANTLHLRLPLSGAGYRSELGEERQRAH